MKPTAMICSFEQFDAIKQKLIDGGMDIRNLTSFGTHPYLVNNLNNTLGRVSNISYYDLGQNRLIYQGWNETLFLSNCGIEIILEEAESKPKRITMRNLTIPIKDMLEIHGVACQTWKTNIADKYLPRMSYDQTITFTEEEIQIMFEAATEPQFPILEKIFGPKRIILPVDYSKLKGGSKVLINSGSDSKWGCINGNNTRQFSIVLYNEEFILNSDTALVKVSVNTDHAQSRATTLVQDGQFSHFFHKPDNLDYIREVIEY
jgi:hypothetical protein